MRVGEGRRVALWYSHGTSVSTGASGLVVRWGVRRDLAQRCMSVQANRLAHMLVPVQFAMSAGPRRVHRDRVLLGI